ncbi:DUF3551 domain-containing protein [Rhodoplanes sp. Z2-YC6860]|uniref:DUF3551 domain-containing protein n=1 Tax=Rhodoplanes sp. Z2-YC6860 TaxID=674703 RepID=UPI0009FF82A1
MKKIALTFGFILMATAAHADSYKWCADYAGRNGSNCYFRTYQQCRAAISGNGGFCRPNGFYTGREHRRD